MSPTILPWARFQKAFSTYCLTTDPLVSRGACSVDMRLNGAELLGGLFSEGKRRAVALLRNSGIILLDRG